MSTSDTDAPLTLSLVEDDATGHNPRAATWRLARLPSADDLLRAPLAQLSSFGAPPSSQEDPMQIMQGSAAPIAQLSRTLEVMVQVLDSFRTPTNRPTRWWRWFTGETLEREATFWHACRNLESTAAESQTLAEEVREMREAILREQARTREYAQWLEQLLDVVAEVLSADNASRREAAVFKAAPDYWARFARRMETLQTLQSVTRLSAEQFSLVDTQAQAVLDRYAEITTLLVPLWRQRTGFELFAKSVAPQAR